MPWLREPESGSMLFIATYSEIPGTGERELLEFLQSIGRDNEAANSHSVKAQWNSSKILLPGFQYQRIIRVEFLPKKDIDVIELKQHLIQSVESFKKEKGIDGKIKIDLIYNKPHPGDN